MAKAFNWETLNTVRRATRNGTTTIRAKAEAELPRKAEDDLPPAERHIRKLNRVYRTLRLAAKAKGKRFPTYAQWIGNQPQFVP